MQPTISHLFQRATFLARLVRHSGGRYLRSRQIHPPLVVSYSGRTVLCQAPDSEETIGLYSEVIIDDCYGLLARRGKLKPGPVVDIGANIGLFACWVRVVSPLCSVIAYEPNPKARQWLDQNAASHQIEVRPVAVSRDGGSRHFNPDQLTTLGRLTDDPSGQVIETVAARDVADGREIEFLKVDCEGAEFEIFQDSSLLTRTKMIGLEYHLTASNTMELLCGLLADGGHRVTKIFPRGDYGTMWTERI